jgi:hypothetical protein
MTTYAGIDYGGGITNIDVKAGIRYGIILQNSEVLQAWADSSEPFYVYHCPYCGTELKKGSEAKRCPACYKYFKDGDFDNLEPAAYIYEEEGYACECDDHGDIWITKSPYFTYAQFCSPCAPGACHLNSPLDTPDPRNRCYCFGHDWFEDQKATYPVYSVTTGNIVPFGV